MGRKVVIGTGVHRQVVEIPDVGDHGGLAGLGDDDHAQYQLRSEKGVAGGYASLDGTGKVPSAQLPSGGGGVTDHGALTGLADDDHPQYQLTTGKNAANGYAGLSAGSKITASQMSGVLASADLTNDSALEKTANKNAASGYAGLSAGSKVAAAQMTGVLASSDLTNDGALEKAANKNANNGYAGLDANGRLPLARIVDLTANRVLGRITSGGAVTELTAAELRTLLGLPSTETKFNQSTAAQGGLTSGGGFAADTYVTGSNISIPASALRAGSRYALRMNLVKGAFGVAGIQVNVRFGTNGSTSDTARATLTFGAQAAAADEGILELWVTFRAIGASGVIQVMGTLSHRLSTSGLCVSGAATTQIVTSAGFDTAVANSIIGVSLNGGAAGAIQTQLVQAELENLS